MLRPKLQKSASIPVSRTCRSGVRGGGGDGSDGGDGDDGGDCDDGDDGAILAQAMSSLKRQLSSKK